MSDPVTIDDLLAETDAILARATRHGADQAEVYLSSGAGLDVDIESGRLAGSGRNHAFGGSVRVVRGDRTGFAYFTRMERAGHAVEQALSQSKLAPELPLTFPDPGRYGSTPDVWSETLAGLDPDLAIAAAHELIDAAKAAPDATVAGGVGLQWGVEAIANSHGLAVGGRATLMQASASLVQPDGDSNINAWQTGTSHGLLDAAAVAQEVAATALSLRDPQPGSTGPADVILLPDAGSELISGLILDAVHGDGAMRGKSFWSDRLGDDVAHPGLHVTDEPLHPEAIGGTAFDGEGRTTQDQAILDGGRLQRFLFNTRDAARHGQQPTGNAVRDSFKSGPSTGAHHVVVDHRARMALDQLVSGIDDGYLVDSVLGAHTANATTGDFSVTAANVWRIQRGAVAGACKEVAIGGNLPALLPHLDGVSDTPKAMHGARIPAVRLRDVQVSS